MKISDLLEETFISIKSNKARSALTILGIVIGIGSVIAMVAVGEGAKISVENSIQSIGSNLISVSPGAQQGFRSLVSSGRGSAQSLTVDDADAIKEKIQNINAVAAEKSSNYQITVKGANTNTSVIGTVSDYVGVRSIEMENGYFVSDQNVRTTAKVAVIGPTTRDDLYGEGHNPIGQYLTINKVRFRIIGVTKSKGSSGFFNQDDVVFVPITTMQRYLSGDEYVSRISVQAASEEYMTSVQSDITDLLMNSHKIKSDAEVDFTVTNQADIVETASSVTGVFTILLAAIASISLLVGGIGIMNMMLTTVTERTREIGLRKALGAKREDIVTQFLAESVMLTLIGGVFGLLIGYLLASIFKYFTGTEAVITFSSMLLACGVSAGIGIVFGYYPAKRAARLNPIDALRYE